MDIFKMLSDIAAVIKKPSAVPDNARSDTEKPKENKSAVSPKASDDTTSNRADIDQDLHLSFREAQKAGFQFCYTRKKSVIITSIHVKSDKLVIPAYIDGHPVQVIADECRLITERKIDNVILVLPHTLTKIGENAFSKAYIYRYEWDVPYLSEVYFPKDRITIAKCAFNSQRKIKRLHFGAFTVIGENAFTECAELESVRLENCHLSKGSFNFCKKLIDVTWKNVCCRGDEVFNFTPYEKNKDLLIVGSVLQKYRKKTRQFVVPEGVEIIGREAFRDNNFLESVILPPSVREIGIEAFVNCENLREIDLSNVKVIHRDAFGRCKSLAPKTKIGADTRFVGNPFRATPIASQSYTNDGIVINKTLVGGRPVFSGNYWQISNGIQRISGLRSFKFEWEWRDIPNMTVVFPESIEEIDPINIFSFAKRLVFQNPNVRITGSEGFNENILLTFITEKGSSDIPILFPKYNFGNPAYHKTRALFDRLITEGFDIKAYDEGIFDIGLSMDMLIEIAYKRLIGGYKLSPQNRTRYEEYLQLHIRRAVLYAQKNGDEKMVEFFEDLSNKQITQMLK